jgi:predicted enzyme related to lactoylglutathione lyase
MDAYTTHGAFSWSELMTTDPRAATEFYGTLFGWKVEAMEMPNGTYYMVKVGDAGIGGIMAMPPDAGKMPPNWCPYVTVDDVDATAKQCTALGGKVVHGPDDIPGVGRFAVILDKQGAALNIITYAPREG